MHFLPIISTLRRHRTAAALIILEIALTCAIVCNAVFLIGERLGRMDRESGVAEDEIIRVQITGIGTRSDAAAITAQDLAAIHAIPGVKHVTTTNMVPFGNSSWNTDASTIPDDPDRPINVGLYMGGPELVETLGVQITSGRDFTPEEFVDYDAQQSNAVKIAAVIITRGIGDRLFPGQNPVGKSIYVTGKEPQTIVGVIDQLARPNEFNGMKYAQYAVLLPVHMPYTIGGNYLIRVDAARQHEVLAATDAAFDKVDPNRIILRRQTFAEIRSDFFKQDRAMAWLLFGVSLALLIITALGVVGLASFWVQQRTRQIGIRRALGATRGDILRYFQTENFILATIGIVIGMGLAYGINLWLMHKYEVARLPGEFLPIGAVMLWFLGQIAVLGPALRASAIPPAIATRSV
jgi:putative ABC transport system permease protein